MSLVTRSKGPHFQGFKRSLRWSMEQYFKFAKLERIVLSASDVGIYFVCLNKRCV